MPSASGERAIPAFACRRFSIEEIRSATNGFDKEHEIGKGGFAVVFKGKIGGKVMAFKRLNSKSESEIAGFRSEIKMLSQLRHPNLLSLIGYCDDDNEMIIVYQYMPQGSLFFNLHTADTHLTWEQRVQIALDSALGLEYLHTPDNNNQQGIIHRDVKSHNILLTSKFVGVIADFGLSKISPSTQSSLDLNASVSIKGTLGFACPVYLQTGVVSRKTDVYAFGVVLLELVSGKHAVDDSLVCDSKSLIWWAERCWHQGHVEQLIDPNLIGTVSNRALKWFVQIAIFCVERVPEKRPTMRMVVKWLQTLLEALKTGLDIQNPLPVQHRTISNGAKILGRCANIKPIRSPNSDRSGLSSRNSFESNTSEHSSSNEDEEDDDDERPYRYDEFVPEGLKLYTHREIVHVTSHFGIHTCLKKGPNADLYKGWVDETTYSPCEINSGMPVVIRKLHGCHYSDPRKLQADLEMMTKFQHPNHVKLIGYCLEGAQLFLVHMFMHNGSLEDLLRTGDIARLPLRTKAKIVVGIARGLTLLKEIREDVKHPMQVTASESEFYRHNILLDKDFTAKLSDYDVTKLVKGGYTWEEHVPDKSNRNESRKSLQPFRSDLNGFLMILAEVATGQIISDSMLYKFNSPLNPRGKMSLYEIAKLCLTTCNEKDSESKLKKLLKKYAKGISKLVKGKVGI